MVMARRRELPLPLKWFSIPQCWRYERMTRGRRREHYQWNMDIWGVDGAEAEAELLGAMVCFFSRVGLTSTDIGIKVNSRVVLSSLLAKLGVPDENFAAVCILVDKVEKVPLDSLRENFHALGVTNAALDKLTMVLASSSISDLRGALDSLPPRPRSKGSAPYVESSMDHLERLFDYADAGGFSDWLVFDASVVRGLSYYTGVVFEAFDRSGSFRAIAGGGRYDRLLETFGADEPLPAAGFGFGDAVIAELLTEKGLIPGGVGGSRLGASADVVVCALNADRLPPPEAATMHGAAMKVATAIRNGAADSRSPESKKKEGRAPSVDLVLEAKKSKWIFKHVERCGAAFVCFVAPNEWADSQKVLVKNLATGSQEAVPIQGIVAWLDAEKERHS
jgi:histidyl-tRNA synthetase